jgi:Gpi18-like mannosyltransferase
MFALYDLARDGTDDADRLRAVAYLLVFPSAFFMAMVYTEGLFMGLALGALVLSRRGHWLWASLLALFAPWARAVGVALAIPLAVRWLAGIDREQPLRPQITGRFAAQGLARYVLPVPAIYLVLARLGRNLAFDRTWMLAGGFTMGLSAVLFAFDFWVG